MAPYKPAKEVDRATNRLQTAYVAFGKSKDPTSRRSTAFKECQSAVVTSSTLFVSVYVLLLVIAPDRTPFQSQKVKIAVLREDTTCTEAYVRGLDKLLYVDEKLRILNKVVVQEHRILLDRLTEATEGVSSHYFASLIITNSTFRKNRPRSTKSFC